MDLLLVALVAFALGTVTGFVAFARRRAKYESLLLRFYKTRDAVRRAIDEA